MVKEFQGVYDNGKLVRLPHAVYLPPQFAENEAERFPLLIFLHGAGERGNDLTTGVYRHGPFREIREGRDFPFVVIAPQCPDDTLWEAFQETLETMLDEWIAAYRIDPDRVYLTGLSMGAYGAWSWGTLFPDRFAAMVPLCGSGDPNRASRLRGVPVWAFHGDQDDIVPLSGTANMVEMLHRGGGNVRFTVCEGVGHDCWTATYHGTAIYDWMLAQHR